MTEDRLHPLLAMVERLEPGAVAELAEALAAHLAPLEPPSEAREGALGALSRMLPADEAQVWVARKRYDQEKPAEALSSRTLVKRHGSWAEACQAAASIRSELAENGKRPWVNPARGRRRGRTYSREEVIRAVRMCALSIGRVPTSNVFYDWVRRERRRARGSGAPAPRLPLQRSVERHFGSWSELRSALDEEGPSQRIAPFNAWASGSC